MNRINKVVILTLSLLSGSIYGMLGGFEHLSREERADLILTNPDTWDVNSPAWNQESDMGVITLLHKERLAIIMIRRGDIFILDAMIRKNIISINHKIAGGMSLLFYALYADKDNVVKYLLNNGAHINDWCRVLHIDFETGVKRVRIVDPLAYANDRGVSVDTKLALTAAYITSLQLS